MQQQYGANELNFWIEIVERIIAAVEWAHRLTNGQYGDSEKETDKLEGKKRSTENKEKQNRKDIDVSIKVSLGRRSASRFASFS